MYQYNTVNCWLWFDVLTRPSEHPQCPKVEPKGSLVINLWRRGNNKSYSSSIEMPSPIFRNILFEFETTWRHSYKLSPSSSPAYLATTFITTLAFLQADRFLLHKSFLVPFEPFIYFVQRHLNTEEEDHEDDCVNIGSLSNFVHWDIWIQKKKMMIANILVMIMMRRRKMKMIV